MRNLHMLVAAGVFSVWTAAAQAADVAFALTNARGQPVADAVLTVYPGEAFKSGPIHFDWPLEMGQRNLRFEPLVLIVAAGATVSFPNRDEVRHHVYSFSPAKPFELKLYGREESRKITFDKTGVVALGCNIHDDMVAFIKVVDTPFAAKSDAQGQVVVHGVPAGPAEARIWHPYLKAPGNEIVRALTAPPSGTVRQTVQLAVRAAPDRRGSY